MAEETQSTDQGAAGKNKLVIIIIAAVIALLLIVATILVIVLNSGGDEHERNAGAPTAGQMSQSAPPAAGTPRSAGAKLSVGPMYAFDQFIVNLTTQSGRRYLKTTMNVELTQPALTAELDTKRAVVRDTVISILSSKSIEEISTSKGKDKLKSELVERLNEFLVDGKIADLFFTEFVIQ
ncbi:MAG: flagellar basal body-associated protein FliL [Wolinella sp.]